MSVDEKRDGYRIACVGCVWGGGKKKQRKVCIGWGGWAGLLGVPSSHMPGTLED